MTIESIVLSDDDIADRLQYFIRYLLCVSELLIDPEGEIRSPVFIDSSHFILQEIINKLTNLEARLRTNANVYKTRIDYMRMLQMEREFREDVRFLEKLNAEKARAMDTSETDTKRGDDEGNNDS